MNLKAALAVAVISLFGGVLAAQVGPNPPTWIGNPNGDGLAIVHASPHSGLPTFASSPRGIAVAGANAEERAKSFVDAHGRAFGLANSTNVRVTKSSRVDEAGFEHVRMQQLHKGVPVTGGELIVHLKGPRVMTTNGRTLGELPDDVVPVVTPQLAKSIAKKVVEKYLKDKSRDAQFSEPRLEVLNRTLITDQGLDTAHLAWFIEATGELLREFIWIDAKNGACLFHFSQLTDAKFRTVYNANNTNNLAGAALVRTEGGPATADNDTNKAYDFAGITYDYYLNNHGRDSYDGLGSQLRSTVHYCVPPDDCPDYANAFWNGAQMVYGNGYASADDVVGHELTHAVTEKTAGLYYYNQSGSLNESFSDIFGETIDQGSTLGGGNDTVGARWFMGEDLGIGAIRNMINPALFNNPAKVTNDPFFVCSSLAWVDPNEDHGGVHTNSGVPNHAFALMVDGGLYNGVLVTGIGITKAAKIEYRTLSFYLTSGSGFIDDYNALNQSCTDLVGTLGITAADCTQVRNALNAVEMNIPWCGVPAPPAMCAAGQIPRYTAYSGFEGAQLGNWTATNTAVGAWVADTGMAHSGDGMATGTDPDGNGTSSIHRLTMTNAVTIPAGGRMYVNHLYEFENDGCCTFFDGGIIEFSANGGAFADANSLFEAGHNYDGTLDAGNPFGARIAYTGTSFGYLGTKFNLSARAGQTIKFRFSIGSDQFAGALGWLLDDISIYQCVASAFTDDPLFGLVTKPKVAHLDELRQRINSIRIRRGLTGFAFADALLNNTIKVKAQHINEMRAALNAAYTAAGYVVPSYRDPVLNSGTTIKASHFIDLRNAVLAIEAAP